MKKIKVLWTFFFIFIYVTGITYAASIVPTEIEQPGTQPKEISNLESPDKCDNCHGGYNTSVEPAYNWRGSMMANAGRDQIFWATLAVVEQDFDGAGDLCIRCHSTAGWLAGRSTPTDGSGLAAGDSNGVDCDFCHKATNPDNSDPILKGIMNPPFVANDEGNPPTGYYGSGMASMWGGSEKLGPYSDAEPKHQWISSTFHRSVDFCGICHDVSNPAVGDLAHNNGAQNTADPVVFSGEIGSPVAGKAAFNNFPFMYGIVERTFSEYKAGKISQTLVSDYSDLPSDLKGGVLEVIYNAAQLAGTGGNYQDGTPRYFSCQSCHMHPVTGPGCNKQGVPIRTDLPLHDMTGGNYWMPDAILYLNGKNKLRLGGSLTDTQINALEAGEKRAREQLNLAATLSVKNNTLKIVNHTGHKLISGYPEGRRMWLNIKWYDENKTLLREDGRYGPIGKTFPDPDNPSAVIEVNSILDLHDPNTKIYEAHYGMTQEWAHQLINLGYDSNLPLSFDRITEAVDMTLGELAGKTTGTFHETFHFALNNIIVKDNRIPPYNMSYSEARKRNALPVPTDQYGKPGPNGSYNCWDIVNLNPPVSAKSATINLLYQPTSYEYQLFLKKANTYSEGAFLAEEGKNMFEAWLKTNMAEPYVMATTTWKYSSVSKPAKAMPWIPLLLLDK